MNIRVRIKFLPTAPRMIVITASHSPSCRLEARLWVYIWNKEGVLHGVGGNDLQRVSPGCWQNAQGSGQVSWFQCQDLQEATIQWRFWRPASQTELLASLWCSHTSTYQVLGWYAPAPSILGHAPHTLADIAGSGPATWEWDQF